MVRLAYLIRPIAACEDRRALRVNNYSWHADAFREYDAELAARSGLTGGTTVTTSAPRATGGSIGEYNHIPTAGAIRMNVHEFRSIWEGEELPEKEEVADGV